MSRRLIIVRHGRTAHNADGRFQGHLDTHLDDTGRLQAAVAARQLTAYAPSSIISSDSMRAADTAAPLAALTGLAVHLDERLREVDMGSWTGLTGEQARVQFPDEYADWVAGVDTARGGGETFKAVADRAAAAVGDHLGEVAPGGALVVFTHGGTARALTGWLLELPWEWCWRLSALGNARRTVLAESKRGWRLLEFNVGTAGP
ncbi:MAG: histidine phosphatase family protein [Actinomycetota bacterium]